MSRRAPARARGGLSGASTLLVAGLSAVLLATGYAGVGIASVVVSEERAQSLADAAAHAAVAELMGDAAHDDVAALVQADAGACWWEAPWLRAPGAAHL
ncbi:MAG TPA: pilus assembly protein TadG-related protein, partial [Candidatus Dormibacteraeota bacterium]|nr:pilus assembly protein TadG-related protein [Candidatus Dormibacteraeota bacterium]